MQRAPSAAPGSSRASPGPPRPPGLGGALTSSSSSPSVPKSFCKWQNCGKKGKNGTGSDTTIWGALGGPGALRVTAGPERPHTAPHRALCGGSPTDRAQNCPRGPQTRPAAPSPVTMAAARPRPGPGRGSGGAGIRTRGRRGEGAGLPLRRGERGHAP